MEERNFFEMLREAVGARLGSEYRVTGKQVVKNNNVRLEALLIRKEGSGILPTVYVNSYYERYCEGAELGELADEVCRIYESHCDVSEEEFAFSLEDVKDHIYYRMISRERNDAALSEMPHLDMGEFAVICQCMMYREGEPMGNVRIRNEHLLTWGITKEQLFTYAVKNTRKLLPPTLEPMESVIRNIMQELIARNQNGAEEKIRELDQMLAEEKESLKFLPMYVLSNTYNSEGATSLLYVDFLDRFREQVRQDFYILPSSVHEVILIPEQAAPEYEEMRQMVRDINRTQVPEQEFLSNEVMLYSAFRKLVPTDLLEQPLCG